MVRDGYVRERMAHVEGTRQRQKIYELTDAGRAAAFPFRRDLMSKAIRVRDGPSTREMVLGDIIQSLGGKVPLLDILRQAVHSDVVELGTSPVRKEASHIELLSEAPRLDGFVGRARELFLLTGDDPAVRMVVVLGLAGIGKTWLGAKATEQLRGKRNLFRHRVQPWDTLASLFADVARFLSALGRPGLQAALTKRNPGEAARVLREDLPGTNTFLVFDDVHEAGPETMPFFRLLKEVAMQATDVRVVVLTRRTPPFYDRRDVALARTVREIELGGLDPEEIAGAGASTDADAVEIGRRVGGHPLFLDLARNHPTPSRALDDFRRFMEEEVYAELNDAQRQMMKLASLYRIAIPKESLFRGPFLTQDVLLELTQRSLLRHLGDGWFLVHDTIRDFFAGMLTPTERRDLGAFALAELRSIASRRLDQDNAVAICGALANALELATERRDRIELFETLGGAMERMGDLSGALSAYRKALELGPETETTARLHRSQAAVHEERGDISAARSELDAALASLGAALTEERGWVHVLQSVVARDAEELEEGREYAAEALRIFPALGVPLGEARALLELGYVEYISPDGDAGTSERHLREALKFAEQLGDPAFLVRVRIILANVVAFEGRPAEGAALLAAVRSMAVVRANPQLEKSYLEMTGMISLLVDGDEAERVFGESIHLATKMRDPVTEAMSEFGLGWVALHRLRFTEARGLFETAARKMKEHGLGGHAVEMHFYAALATLLEGDLEGFHSALEWLRDPSLARGCASRYPHVHALRGIEHLRAGDERAVREAFTTALRSVRVQWAFHTHLLYGVALGVLGRAKESQEHFDRADDLARRHRWEVPLAALPAMEGRLLEVLGSNHRRKGRGSMGRR